ncbi:MAG: DUF1501 domain-containing protein [Betaproteobacteria bacterium]|jgi:uncharacterized protein (DUF1501 family)|nr:DUF1501 domain-containing protein [Betaproteobacteria bacterium]
MSGPMTFSRRRFLRQAGGLSALSLAGSLDLLGLSSAAAQTGGDYKALVCLFLFGGNDSNSLVIPYSGYASYDAVRPLATGVNVAASLLTPIAPANLPGQTFALHPAFTATNGNPTLTSLFQSGRLAVVANAGTLVEPLTRAEYRAGTKRRPQQLFSHSDQQQQYQTSISESSVLTAPTGWGGRIGDELALSMNGPLATPIGMSFSGAQTFLNGSSVRGLSLPTAGNFGYTGDSPAPNAMQIARGNARAELILATDSNAMISSAQSSMMSALNASQRINPILNGTLPTTISTPFAGLNSGLANQLRAVARLVANRATLGQRRQIFFVSIGGFDTHTGQGQFQPPTPAIQGLASLYQQIGQAMSAFYQSTVNLGVQNEVTTFMLSDFNRTFRPNGVGTDHAWGGNYLVMGGAVQGNRFYGQYPNLALGGPDDADSLGRWIPTTAIDQYGATLARWFGVPDADLVQVFPNVGRFATSNLGFMG